MSYWAVLDHKFNQGGAFLKAKPMSLLSAYGTSNFNPHESVSSLHEKQIHGQSEEVMHWGGCFT